MEKYVDFIKSPSANERNLFIMSVWEIGDWSDEQLHTESQITSRRMELT